LVETTLNRQLPSSAKQQCSQGGDGYENYPNYLIYQSRYIQIRLSSFFFF